MKTISVIAVVLAALFAGQLSSVSADQYVSTSTYQRTSGKWFYRQGWSSFAVDVTVEESLTPLAGERASIDVDFEIRRHGLKTVIYRAQDFPIDPAAFDVYSDSSYAILRPIKVRVCRVDRPRNCLSLPISFEGIAATPPIPASSFRYEWIGGNCVIEVETSSLDSEGVFVGRFGFKKANQYLASQAGSIHFETTWERYSPGCPIP